jgi:hypothetical protein
VDGIYFRFVDEKGNELSKDVLQSLPIYRQQEEKSLLQTESTNVSSTAITICASNTEAKRPVSESTGMEQGAKDDKEQSQMTVKTVVVDKQLANNDEEISDELKALQKNYREPRGIQVANSHSDEKPASLSGSKRDRSEYTTIYDTEQEGNKVQQKNDPTEKSFVHKVSDPLQHTGAEDEENTLTTSTSIERKAGKAEPHLPRAIRAVAISTGHKQTFASIEAAVIETQTNGSLIEAGK